MKFSKGMMEKLDLEKTSKKETKTKVVNMDNFLENKQCYFSVKH